MGQNIGAPVRDFYPEETPKEPTEVAESIQEVKPYKSAYGQDCNSSPRKSSPKKNSRRMSTQQAVQGSPRKARQVSPTRYQQENAKEQGIHVYEQIPSKHLTKAQMLADGVDSSIILKVESHHAAAMSPVKNTAINIENVPEWTPHPKKDENYHPSTVVTVGDKEKDAKI